MRPTSRRSGNPPPQNRPKNARPAGSLLHEFPSYSLPYEEKMRWNYGKHSQSHYPDRDAGVPAGIFTPEPRAEIFSLSACRGAAFGHGGSAPVLAAEDVLEQAELFEGERFTIEGQIRSFNNREPTGRRLILCVYALSMTTTDAPMQNEAVLTGTVCQARPSTGRRRSDGRSPICVWPCRACTAGRIISPAFCGAGRRWPPPNTRPHGADAHGQAPEPDVSQKLGRDERDAHRV